MYNVTLLIIVIISGIYCINHGNNSIKSGGICYEDLDNFYTCVLTDVTFPFECPYADGILSSSGNLHLYPENSWLECKRFNTLYYECLDFNTLYRLPVYKRFLGFEKCYKSNRYQMSAKCNSTGIGRCRYNNSEYNFCDAYMEICKSMNNPHCVCFTKLRPTHFCQQRKCTQNPGLNNLEHKCLPCDKEFEEYGTPTLTLKYKNKRLVLTATSYKKLKVLKENNRINCITDISKTSDIFSSGVRFLEYNEVYKDFDKIVYEIRPRNYSDAVPARYWCQGFVYPNMTLVKSNIVTVAMTDYGFDLAIKLYLDFNKHNHLYVKTLLINVLNIVKMVRVVELLPVDENMKHFQGYIFHLTTLDTNMNLSYILDHITTILERDTNITFIYILSSDFCIEEITKNGSFELHWRQTPIGYIEFPNKLCYGEDGKIISRTCSGDFVYGANWSDVAPCTGYVPTHSTTEDLNDLLHSNITTEELNAQLENILKNVSQIATYDVFLSAKIIQKIASSGDNFSTDTLVNSINHMMDINKETLKASQRDFNATDLVLHYFDKCISNSISYMNSNNKTESSKNLVMHVTEVNMTVIRGIAFYNRENFVTIEYLVDDDIKSFNKTNLQFAIIIPNDLMQQIDATDYKNCVYLITLLYKRDSLFNDVNETNDNLVSWIPSIFIPGFEKLYLSSPFILLFNHSSKLGKKSCAFWKYTSGNYWWEQQKGTWSYDGDPQSIDGLSLCYFWHLTHFGILVGSEEAVKDVALNIITAIGCILSLIGILGIFVTVTLFDKLRNDNGSKILVNFSISILFQMTLLFLSGSVNHKKRELCLFVGISLHYSIMAQFCWMLVISFLQYRRFVLALSEEPKHVVIKACIIGWAVPALIVSPTPILNIESYIQYDYCYLNGDELLYGILLPVSIIICMNLAMFFKIFTTMCCCKQKTAAMTKEMKVQNVKLQIRLAVFLFFLMGFTWIFGLFSTFLNSLALSYLFCMTGTMQGLVLFIFYIILNKNIREYWGKWINSLRIKNM